MSDSYSQKHEGSGDNVMNFGKMPFELTDSFLAALVASLDPKAAVSLTTIGGDLVHRAMGNSVAGYLQQRGFSVTRTVIGQQGFQVHLKPLHVTNNEVVFDPT